MNCGQKRRGFDRGWIGVALVLVLPPGTAAQDLSFLEPLIGTWVPDSVWLVENPGAAGLIPLSLEWGSTRHSIVYRAGMPLANGALFTTGVIAWNPESRRAEFMASQGRDGLLFRGHYESVDATAIRRVYAVHYPDRPTVWFRETFFFAARETIDWLTEWERDGQWMPRRGTGAPEFRATRVLSRP